jgi:hypothetical protein
MSGVLIFREKNNLGEASSKAKRTSEAKRISEAKIKDETLMLNCKCSSCGELHTFGVEVSTLKCSCGNTYEVWFHNTGPFLKKVENI